MKLNFEIKRLDTYKFDNKDADGNVISDCKYKSNITAELLDRFADLTKIIDKNDSQKMYFDKIANITSENSGDIQALLELSKIQMTAGLTADKQKQQNATIRNAILEFHHLMLDTQDAFDLEFWKNENYLKIYEVFMFFRRNVTI